MGNELAKSNEDGPTREMRRHETAFSSMEAFENAQRMATALSKSDLVPKEYKENLPNCILALEMSQRIGMNPLMIMQNMYIVHGKPSWSGQFMVACINGSGNFSPLRYELSGKEGADSRTCIAWAYDKASGDRLESTPVSIKMAKDEGWYQKNGSKWKTMPELMLRYRSATFFGRTYCPELTMGMQTTDEIKDIGEATVVEDDPLAPGRHSTRRKPDPVEPEIDMPSETPQGAADAPEGCKAYNDLRKAYESDPGAILTVLGPLGCGEWADLDPQDKATCSSALAALKA